MNQTDVNAAMGFCCVTYVNVVIHLVMVNGLHYANGLCYVIENEMYANAIEILSENLNV